MPESSVRKAAAEKKKIKRHQEVISERIAKTKATPFTQRRWVVPTFITVGLMGVLWIITYYLAGAYIPAMASLGDWNMLIGMGLIAASFVIMTFWK